MQNMPAPQEPQSVSPDLSRSFQEFVRPLLDQLPRTFRLTELRDPLLVAAAVWNEVIALDGDLAGAVADVVEMIEEFQQRPVSHRLQEMLDFLAARKWSSFRGERRLIVELRVHRQGADVRVDARSEPREGMNAVLVPWFSARRAPTGGAKFDVFS